MTRFLVPAMLVALLAAQLALVAPAYNRSQVRLVEAVYDRPPDRVYRGPSEMLGAAEMARLLHQAAKRRGAVEARSTPDFEETTRLLVVRFGLLQGDPREVAAEFGPMLSAAARDALLKNAPGAAAPGSFTLTAVRESRPSWLRPLDLIAAAVNIAAIAIWVLRRRRAGARESQG